MTKNNNILVLADLESPLIKSRIEMLQELGYNNYILHNASCLELQNNIVKEYSKLGTVLQNPAIKSPKIRRFVSFFLTLYLVLRLRPKLIVVHWASRLWQSVILGLFGSRVIVHTMNGDINPLYDGKGSKKKFTFFLLNRAAAITVKSGYGLTLLVENFSPRLLEKTHIMSWGVERSLLECDRVDIRAVLGVGKESKIIFCPRSMQAIYHKKEIAIAFFEYLDESKDGTYLVVSTVNSHQKYMDEYKDFISASRYAKSVIFVNLQHEDMASFLHQSDAVVSFTKSDGLSQTVMEGLAINARIICYEMPDYKGILVHQKNSFLFADNKGIKEGIKYFVNKNNKVETIDSVADMLDYEVQKQKYIKLCKAVIAGEKN